MGTRADFYIRKNSKMQWLGSIAWDGGTIAGASDINHYSVNEQQRRSADFLEHLIHSSSKEQEFLGLIEEYLSKRDDSTLPSQGWPWPWNNSKLTDECYVFDTEIGRTLHMISHDGNFDDHSTDCTWGICGQVEYNEQTGELETAKPFYFKVPDMETIKNVARGGRSGIMTIGIPIE